MKNITKEFGLHIYQINTKQLIALFGSKDWKVLEDIQQTYANEMQQLSKMYYLEEENLSSEDILTAFLEGDVTQFSHQGHAFVFLTEILCKKFGKTLSNEYWNPCNFDYELFEVFQTSFDIQSPLPLPENDDYTFQVLYCSYSKIHHFLHSFDDMVLHQIFAEDEVSFKNAAIQEFKSWFDTALNAQQDLMLFVEALTQ